MNIHDHTRAKAIMAPTLGDALRLACVEVGIVERDVPVDGTWHKADINGDPRGRGDGRIKLFLDGEGGVACNWKGERRLFFVGDGHRLTKDERLDRERRRVEAILRMKEEQDREHAAAEAKAVRLWNTAIPAPDNHFYLVKRGIKPHDLRVRNGVLLVPVYIDNRLCSLQFITPPDGNKRFLAGGAVSGGCFCIGELNGASTLCIAEGVATAASVHEATGHPAVAAFNCGNLLPVAKAMRKRFPDLRLIICADDDVETLGNPGVSSAVEAAGAVGGTLAVPKFPDPRDPSHTDMNDLAAVCGMDAVREAIVGASAPAEKDEDAFRRLAALSAVEYDRVREDEAKRLKIRVATLDAEVEKGRKKPPVGEEPGDGGNRATPPPSADKGNGAGGANPDPTNDGLDEAEGKRPVIEVRAGDLDRILQDALGALKGAGAPIYLRGDAIYRPVKVKDPPKDDDHTRRPVGALVLRMIDSIWTRLQLARAATWQKWDARKEVMRPADPPKDIAEVVATQSDIGDWPVLRAVTSHPVITLRGRVISTPGYDPGSGLLLEISSDWPIPAAPTRDDAVAAWERLKELLRYFPWVSDVDRAVAISMLMTGIARPALRAAPGHAMDAPEAGTGKSLLVDVTSILASGTEAPVMDYGRDAIEAGKRLDAMLIAGDPIISIDNIDAPIEGAALCATLTQTVRSIRVLGLSKSLKVPCMAMLTFTGNNLVLRGDVVRRVLVCRLDAETERPELRDFDQDLIAEASEYRRHLVADIITIMLAYQLAGHPDVNVPRFGSYEPWSLMVRQPLVWVGEADPCLSLERTRGGDPSRQDLGAVLEAWHAAFGKDPVTAAEAVKEAWEGSDLRVGLAAVCERRGALDTRALGNWLRTHRDRRSGNLVLRAAPGRAGVSRWCVTDAG